MNIGRAQDALVGRSLGEFVLRERIGQGGFGSVYRATQPALDREAVIKVLHSRLHASSAATERFLREAKLASKLDHPYAAHIYAFGAEADGQLWIAMELVRGTPLDRLLELGALPLERFVPLLDRICEVVHSAHEQGIVHRDLKPANVMVLARAGRMLPKLLDFGIAKGLATPEVVASADTVDPDDAGIAHTLDAPATSQPGLTQRGAIMGSPHYMAPEQWLDAGSADARTDIYALAILAYEALTGKPPFSGKTVTALATAHANDAPPPLGPRFPAALDKVIEKALAKEPADRYADVLAFATAFRQAAGIGGDTASLPALDAQLRDAAINRAPQPIAEAIAAYEAARNAHQARDAAAQLVRTIARYLGLLALACRSRIGVRSDSLAIGDALRALYRRSLGDKEWLELARQLTRSWIDRRDGYPIPELIGVFHDQRGVAEELEALTGLREGEPASEGALVAALEIAVARLSRVLDALAFLDDYALVVTLAHGVAERWMGVRRPQRTTMPVRGKNVEPGVPALLDKDGVPVLSLAPLVQVAAPTPGAPLDLFLFEGRDRRGAKLVALPSGFEHHDDELWSWFRAELSISLDEAEAQAAEEKPPYRGLSAFSVDDGAMFFGREKLVDAFANRLRVQPLLVVVGRSGAGKSSFVQAGVIPALPAGWRAITMRPGPAPVAALIARLEHAGITVKRDLDALGDVLRADAVARGPLLLVIDQLEEMFTLCSDGEERRVFAEALAGAARAAEDPVRVVFTLRDDFLVRAEQLPSLRNRIAQGLQLLTVPASEDLLRIVIEPARRAGYELEDADLSHEIVREVADQPGALALISFTAAKLWELRDRHFKQLTRAAYKSLGGVGGALARHAELTLQEMLPEERALTREAFRHLVTTQSTRAVVRRQELRQLLGGGEHADRVIEKLVAARLLVATENEAGAETIEIIHEALLSAWPRLADWRREDAEGTRFREQLRSAAGQWEERGRARGLLWRDDALADFTRWRARHAGPLTDGEAAFTDASLADGARGRRNRRLLLASAFAALVAIVVGLVVFNARIAGQRAQLHDHLERQYEDEGRRFVLAGDPLQALAYLTKAGELGASGRAHDFLVAQAIQATDGELLEVHQDGELMSARFSHDGKRFVTAGFDHTARVWDATTGTLLITLSHRDVVTDAAFSEDDSLVVTASNDGTAAVWDAATGRIVRRFAQTGEIDCSQLSRNGKQLLTLAGDGVVLWDVETGAERFRAPAMEGGGRCAFSGDGSVIAVGDSTGKVRLWNAASGVLLREVQGEQAELFSVRFAPTGLHFVTASSDRNAVEWDGATGARLHQLPHKGAVTSAQYSPDGRQIVTSSDEDHVAVVWDAATGTSLHVLGGHSAAVRSATYSPDGQHIVTASEDATVQLWDAATGRREARWFGHRGTVAVAGFDRDGARVVSAGSDGSAIVWKAQAQAHVRWLAGHSSYIQVAKFSGDGRWVVTASYDGTARVWNARTGITERTLSTGAAVTDASFSPDGLGVATATWTGVIEIWDLATGTSRARFDTGKTISGVAWSPDGTQLVSAGLDGMIRCWDLATRRQVFESRAHGGQAVLSVAFDPAGSSIITTGRDMIVRVWDRAGNPTASHPQRMFYDATFDRDRKRVLSVGHESAAIWNAATGATEVELVGHAGVVMGAAWSPDGATAITAAADGTARIWDSHSGDELALFEDPAHARTASFSPDGRQVVIGHDDGSVALRELPERHLTPSELATVLRCRVPFDVVGDRVRPRARDRAGCQDD